MTENGYESYEFKNNLNFLPSPKNVAKTKSSHSDKISAAKTGRIRMTPMERREFEAEELKMKKEIKKWERIKKNKFSKKCFKEKVESMAPSGFDSWLDKIMMFVMINKPPPKEISSAVSSFLDEKLDLRTMDELNIHDRKELTAYETKSEEGMSFTDYPSFPLDDSTIDSAPSAIGYTGYTGYTGYKGNKKQPHNRSTVSP